MSNEEATQLMDTFEARDSKQHRREFIARMERKLHRKEHDARSGR